MDVRVVDAANRRKYSGAVYDAASICHTGTGADYQSRMLRLKLDMVRECPGPVLVDLCCGSGAHLAWTASGRALAIGVDFSEPFLRYGAQRIPVACFVGANARTIPLRDGSVDALYCLASLYVLPEPQDVVREIARVLHVGGRCVLDVGNSRSLNAFVNRYYPELSASCFVPIERALADCRNAGLRVLTHRRFQLLPMWGDRPRWLKPLLAPIWPRLLAREFRGRMLDEWVASLPVLQRFAFRHVLLCEKHG